MNRFACLLILAASCALADFGRVLDGSLIRAPEYLSVNGSVVCNPSAAQYAAHGWLPVGADIGPSDVPPGFSVAVTNYCVIDGVIHGQRGAVPAPRTFSVYKVTAELMRLGIWTNAYAFIEQNGLLPLYYTAREFSEDDPNFERGVRIIKAHLDLDDEFVESVLGKAVIE